jgi:hypothetical protein
VTDTVPALAELEQLGEAFRMAAPWLSACVAGDGAAAEAVGRELMIGELSRDHQLLVHGLSAIAVSLLSALPDSPAYVDGLLARVAADVAVGDV